MAAKAKSVGTVIDRMTEDEKKELAVLAIRASKGLGYCDEAANVLEEMGLSIPSRSVEVTLRVTVPDVNISFDLDAMSTYVQFEAGDGGYEVYESYSDSVEVISTKEV